MLKLPMTTSQNGAALNNINQTPINTTASTPLCLINELVRYNKIQHQYKLISETGPAHKKVFTISLKIGDEEYVANGTTIKRAQHAAAADALEKTKFKQRPPKTVDYRLWDKRPFTEYTNCVVTLQELAMKRGDKPPIFVNQPMSSYPMTYHPQENMFTPHGQFRFGFDNRETFRQHFNNYDNLYYWQYNSNYQQHSRSRHSPLVHQNVFSHCVHKVYLMIGGREYYGVGSSWQNAREDAAHRALTDTNGLYVNKQQIDESKSTANTSSITNLNGSEYDDAKSPISLVYEIALKRKLNVKFQVISEMGPAHLKEFVTECRVGDDFLCTKGVGTDKKISKQRSAKHMLDELAKLPKIDTATIDNNQTGSAFMGRQRKRIRTKRKSRNLIKVNVDQMVHTNDSSINPISRLIHIQQSRKEKAPIFTVIPTIGGKGRTITVEGTLDQYSACGVGPNKKVAKRNAAEQLLTLLGYNNNTNTNCDKSSTNPENNASNTNGMMRDCNTSKMSNGSKKPDHPLTTIRGTVTTNGYGCQLVPGVLLVGEQKTIHQNIPNGKKPETGTTRPINTIKTSDCKEVVNGKDIPAKEKLIQLAKLKNIDVKFMNFPKANHDMFLTLISLATTPKQVCMGEGYTTDSSHESASLQALKVLNEMDLNNSQTTKQNTLTTTSTATTTK